MAHRSASRRHAAQRPVLRFPWRARARQRQREREREENSSPLRVGRDDARDTHTYRHCAAPSLLAVMFSQLLCAVFFFARIWSLQILARLMDGGGQGSCLRRSGSDSAVGGPACSALCSSVRAMLLGAGLCGAGRAHAAAEVRPPGTAQSRAQEHGAHVRAQSRARRAPDR